jgi:hypothetical protein
MAIAAAGEGWWSWISMQGEALRGDPDYGNLFMGFQFPASFYSSYHVVEKTCIMYEAL